MATSSRLPGNAEATDVPQTPDIPCEVVEDVIPENRFTRGLLPEWDTFCLHDQLIRAMSHQSFTQPTPIQLKALPSALQGKDVIGVAETVCNPLSSTPIDAYFDTGIGKNSGVWVACTPQTPLADETSRIEIPQASARIDTSPNPRTCAPNIITLERLSKWHLRTWGTGHFK
jgi:hypothetical protein